MKKRYLLLMFLCLVICISVYGATGKAAVKLNTKTLTMIKGDSFTLKPDQKKKNIFSSNNKSIATVSKNGKVVAKGNGKTKIIAVIGKKKLTCKINVCTKDNISTQIHVINNFIVGSLWNGGFCDISHYTSDGRNAVGQKMNLAKTLARRFSVHL